MIDPCFRQQAGVRIMEIEAAGFSVEPHRIVSETVSGSTAVAQRKGSSRLLDRMEKGDVLVVTKLDRLGPTPSMSAAPSRAWRKWA